MKKLMQILFLSCLRATELIEKKLHFKLSYTENMQLKAHKMMCKACKNYEKQNILLDKVLKHDTIKDEVMRMEEISKLKEQIMQKLSKNS